MPVGSHPTIEAADTFATVSCKAGVTLEELVEKMQASSKFLDPAAGVQLVERTHTYDADDTFASVLEQLAPNLTARGMLRYAVEILDALNGEKQGVFVPGEELGQGERQHKTTKDDTLRNVAAALDYDVFEFIEAYYVKSPLLAEAACFRYLTLYPPSTISAGKIAMYAGGEPRSKLNTVYVTTAPNEARSVKLKLAYDGQALKYNIRNVDGQASDTRPLRLAHLRRLAPWRGPRRSRDPDPQPTVPGAPKQSWRTTRSRSSPMAV